MGDLLEVIIISSAGIIMTLIAKISFKNKFGILYRKFVWLLIAIRMLIIYNPAFLPEQRLSFPIMPLSSYNDLIIMGVIPHRTINSGLNMGILYETPIIYLIITGIILISVIKIMVHHEEYGFAINNLIEQTTPVNEGLTFELFKQTHKELGIQKKIVLYTSKQISSPMIIGYIHVGIVIPQKLVNNVESGEIDKEYIRYVLLHELTHFQKKDIWYKRLLLLISDLYWFNPLVYILQNEAVKDLECCCDSYVTKHFSDEEKQTYCNILLDFMNIRKESNRFKLDMSIAANRIKERIDNITDSTSGKNGVPIVIGILLIMLFAGQIQIESNPQYQHGLTEFSNQLMDEVMHACEVKVKNSLSIETDISYENSLGREFYTKEDLENGICIRVKFGNQKMISDENKNKIWIIINSYFGVTMDVIFE